MINTLRIALATTAKKDPEKMEVFCQLLKKQYNLECGWYPMNPTLHKGVDHSPQYIRVCPPSLSTGMTSEEPCEAAVKFARKFQTEHSFQGDPEQRNRDVFNRFLDRSNPKTIAHLEDKKVERRANEVLPESVQELLLQK